MLSIGYIFLKVSNVGHSVSVPPYLVVFSLVLSCLLFCIASSLYCVGCLPPHTRTISAVLLTILVSHGPWFGMRVCLTVAHHEESMLGTAIRLPGPYRSITSSPWQAHINNSTCWLPDPPLAQMTFTRPHPPKTPGIYGRYNYDVKLYTMHKGRRRRKGTKQEKAFLALLPKGRTLRTPPTNYRTADI